jgi:hypothetical protein
LAPLEDGVACRDGADHGEDLQTWTEKFEAPIVVALMAVLKRPRLSHHLRTTDSEAFR